MEGKRMEEKIKNLIEKYEKYISTDNEEELDEYRKGDRNALTAVIQDLKEIVKSENLSC
jgi:hypothetical protein